MGNETDYLADAWKRLEWANNDGEALEGALRELQTMDPHPHAIHYVQTEGEWWQASFHRFIDPTQEQLLFERFSRLFGSFLDHSRAALNYLAVQLGHLAICQDPSLADPGLPWRQQLRPLGLEFPIFNAPAKFAEMNPVRKLPEEMRRAIEDEQPYNGQNQGLWYLQNLAVEFRHAIIHPSVIWPLNDHHRIFVDGEPIPSDNIEIVARGALEHGDVILKFRLIDRNPNAHVDPQLALDVGVENPVCGGKRLIELINEMGRDTNGVINRLEAKFFS